MDTGIFIGDKIITTSWDKIWDKPNTLSGYGITDAVTIDTHQQIYGTKEFRQTVFIDTQSDVKLIIRDDDNRALIGAANSKGSVLSRLGYYGDRWGIDGYKILTTNNYSAELDNRYVNKAGDTMTGKLLFNADSGIDLTSIPRTKSAISFNNAGSNRIGINFTDGDGNLRIARTDINQDWVSGDVNILLGSNNYKVWHAGNDGSGSGLDADLLDGKHLHQGQWDSICYIGGDGVLEIGKFIDFHEEPGIITDFSCRIKTQGDHHNTITLPAASGTLATLDDNVYSATKLQTPRYIFSKPFDGTSNVTGGAKFLNICIETDNNGNDSGRGSEINNYVGPLQLQQASPNGIHMCMGGGQVGICTTSPKYTLHVDGVIYAKDGFRETSDIRKKKVLNSHTVSLDDMAYADLFDYTLIDDEKEIVKVGTNAHYWLDKLPQVVTKDNDEYLSLNYGVLGTVCALSVSKYVKQLEDRVTLLENKIASL
jgi:hypothetical protein